MTTKNDLASIVPTIAAREHMTRRQTRRVLQTFVATVKHRALIEQGSFVIPYFGTFDARYVDHGKVVNGNATRPQLVLRFLPSRHSRKLVEESDGQVEE